MSVLSKSDVSASIADFETKRLVRSLLEVATIAAAGSTIADATALTAGRNMVTAADDAKGVLLPHALPDMRVEVVNTVSNKALLVYPFSSAEQINAITAGDSFSVAAGTSATFYCDADLHWYVRAAGTLTGVATSATTNQLDIAAVPASGIELVTATNVIAASESGTTYFLNSATEFVSTLPAVAAGLKFSFIVKAAPSGASYTVVTNASANVIKGQQQSAAGDAGDTGTADDTITFVDGQAVAGDRVDVICDGTYWYAYAQSAVAAGVTFTQAS